MPFRYISRFLRLVAIGKAEAARSRRDCGYVWGGLAVFPLRCWGRLLASTLPPERAARETSPDAHVETNYHAPARRALGPKWAGIRLTAVLPPVTCDFAESGLGTPTG